MLDLFKTMYSIACQCFSLFLLYLHQLTPLELSNFELENNVSSSL